MSPEDEREFRDFVTSRSPALLLTAYLLTGDPHLAQDLLQSALLACARKWTQIQRREHLEAYVRRAMYRQQINRWRARRRRPETLVAAPPERPVACDLAAEASLRQSVVDALLALPPKQRAVVVLRYYEDRSEREVATLLNISVGTVRSQASRALAKLRVHYLESDGSPDHVEVSQ